MFCILVRQKAFPCTVAGTIYWSGFCLAPNGDPRSLSRSRILVLSSTSTFRSVRREWSAMHKRLEERRMRANATAADQLFCRRWSELVSVMIFGGRMLLVESHNVFASLSAISFLSLPGKLCRTESRFVIKSILVLLCTTSVLFPSQYNYHMEHAISSQYKNSPHTENVSLK